MNARTLMLIEQYEEITQEEEERQLAAKRRAANDKITHQPDRKMVRIRRRPTWK